MKKSPLFSVIIPTYNRGHLVMQTIESVINQDDTDFEIILVNDGSTDDTELKLSKITDDRFIYLKITNSERGAARNKGAAIAKGQYLNFVDSDDKLLKNHLSIARETISKLNNPEFFHLNYEIRDNNDRLIKKGIPKYFFKKVNEKLYMGNPFSCNGVFLRHDIGLKFRFNEDRKLSASEDYELWIRLGARYKLHCVDTVTSVIIAHEGRSVLNTNIGSLQNRKELLLKYSFEDEAVKSVFKTKLNAFNAFADTYIALHLVLGGEVKKGLKYLINAVRIYPLCLKDRRILGILKHAVLQTINKNK